MKYDEMGFRGIYRQLNALKLTDQIRKTIADFPDADKANCVLTYGYIDHEAGVTLEILAGAKKEGNRFQFFNGNDSIRSFIRIEAVENDDLFWFEDADNSIKVRYSEKIKMLQGYDVSEEIEKTRGMGFLDESRDPHCVDDVLVYLTREGLQPEGCWVRISGLGDHWIMGTLLNEPNQDFGYHMGETIAFFVHETEDKKVICYSDMTPSMKLTAEDLADGSMLKEAIHAFNAERTEEHFIDIMEFLRDSLVWVPCNAILGEEDQAMFEKAVDEAGADLSSLVGKTFSNQQHIRMVPDILQNGDRFFFPAFSSVEEMGEYGDHFSKVQKHMLEVIPLAINNEKNVAGIVINAFTEPFVLERSLFDMVEKMKSRIKG